MHHLSFVILVTLRDIHLPFGAGRRKFPLEGRFPAVAADTNTRCLTDTSFPACHAHALFLSCLCYYSCPLFFFTHVVLFPLGPCAAATSLQGVSMYFR
ncbi:hypothetical protein BO83DRAFT_220332 [Aspergillus eucalypticola CBS 122712]|uniref:Uncharacterized protein n=1 Tax=Aspergillus eucalypticola (strain CBS 122712 / IBT 29274) TaxID=1448314 RepID=A0A317VX69_ASPEC|nr:uncharacterized protein BO83DRAFT_220332 [Aspergillus eucalypticola CBS 122712]PWY77572.1 hypothetical protein BO83DRAFT_220332 [Aspergillus eucalypticola CBS 122712]